MDSLIHQGYLQPSGENKLDFQTCHVFWAFSPSFYFDPTAGTFYISAGDVLRFYIVNILVDMCI